MSKVQILEQLKGMKMSQFAFTSFEIRMASAKDGEERIKQLVFQLDTPIEKVTSSLTVANPDNWNDRKHLFKEDVVTVLCNLDMVEKYPDEWDFDVDTAGNITKAGSYKGDLFLDLSSRGEVWLTDVKFSKYGSEQRKKDRTEIWAKLNGDGK